MDCECDELRDKLRQRLEFCRECGADALKELEQLSQAGSEAVSAEFALLSCADVAEGMRGNKNKLVFFDDLHRVLELDVVKYGGEDDVLLIYLKKVE